MGIKSGPFNLGRFSKPVMAYACIWTLFVLTVFIFSNYMPVDKENMNYTVIILGFCLFFSGIWYAVDARKWYLGLRCNIDEDGNSNGDSSTDNVVEAVEENYKAYKHITKEKVASSINQKVE